MPVKTRKKLIEIALPLEAINEASAREKLTPQGHPWTLHLWWARRPLATARAVIFSQMVDDPSAVPELFPTTEAQNRERDRLFGIIEEMVKWKNTTNDAVMQKARDEIWKSWRRACADNADHPQAKELFNPDKLPAFHDPFAGGGSLPLEAQRLGFEAYASDLNPVAVLICKTMIEIPPKFAGKPPVNPDSQAEFARGAKWNGKGAQGLAEDVRYYGKWMRDEASKRIGHLYPKIEVTAAMAAERPDLKPYLGKKLTVIAWLWARTVKSPNPAFANVAVPLASTFMLSTKPGKEAYVEPVIEGGAYRFTVKVGTPKDAGAAKHGTSAGKQQSFQCLVSGVPITYEHIRTEGKAGRLGARLMAIVAEGSHGRVYLAPTAEHETLALGANSALRPEISLPEKALGFRVQQYGMKTWSALFTCRQLVALTTFSDLVTEARERIHQDALTAGLADDGKPLRDGGLGAQAYAEAMSVYLAFAVDRVAMTGNSLVRWNPVGAKAQHCFGRQALPMVWDFAETNPIASSTGSIGAAIFYTADPANEMDARTPGIGTQSDAMSRTAISHQLISTDPPYYDNVGYAELSDFFYVWLRRSLRSVFPDLFATLAVPKDQELVATPYRHGSREKAEAFFLDGMTRALHRFSKQTNPVFPVTLYYAFKQSATNVDARTASTGWETFLDAVTRTGFATTGTIPIRTESNTRLRSQNSNALASSIVLVCRPRDPAAPSATRRELIATLQAELPHALRDMQAANIAPVDLAQAAIGPGMAIYTRYSKVLNAAGEVVTVHDALALINQTLDETLAEQEGDLDADTRWALAWFEQNGFSEGDYGIAETLSKAKNVSIETLKNVGLLESSRGKVRLLPPQELHADWNPNATGHATAWQIVNHLAGALTDSGEHAAAEIAAKCGSRIEGTRDLAYQLYSIAERKKRSSDAILYNNLVQSWPEIARLSKEIEQGQQNIPGLKEPAKV